MWTALGLLFLLFSGMLTFSLGHRFFFAKTSQFSLQKLNAFSAIFLCVSVILGSGILYICNPYLPTYTWGVILFLLWALFYFSQNNWSKFSKILFQLGLCSLGTIGILLPLPQMNLMYWLLGGALVFAWFVGWRFFSGFDRYPLTSSLVSTGWSVALLIALCIFNNFPYEVSVFAGILGVCVYVISFKRLSYGIANLGAYTSEIAGFIWGGIWAICLLQTDMTILFLVYAYYLMEMIVLLFQYLRKEPSETLLMKALSDNKKRKKAISTVFSHVMAMAFFAIVLVAIKANSRLSVSISLIFGVIISLDLYSQLKSSNCSSASWKEIFSEFKKGISALPKASKDFAKEVKAGLRTQTKKKKIVTRKQGHKKKVSKRNKKK